MTDRIMTLHPQGKSGVNIDRKKYDAIREARGIIQRMPGSSPQRMRMAET